MMNQKITIIGIGRLGICLALCLERAGYQVLGVDVASGYISQINDKTLSSSEPKVNEYLKASKNFRATTSLQEGLEYSDMIFIVAPTNTVPDAQTYDHTIVTSILTQINAAKVANKHIILSSTVFPGYLTKTAQAFDFRLCQYIDQLQS